MSKKRKGSSYPGVVRIICFVLVALMVLGGLIAAGFALHSH